MRPPLISTDIIPSPFACLTQVSLTPEGPGQVTALSLAGDKSPYGVEHDLGAQSGVRRIGILLRGVADAVFARDEDHRARHPVGDAHGVVGRARVHRHVRLAARLRGFLESRRHAPVKWCRRQGLALRVLGAYAAPLGGRLRERGDVARDAAETLLVRAPDVQREAGLARHRVYEVRAQLDLSDRPDRSAPGLLREAVQLEHALGHDDAGVLAEVHGRRPGMIAAPVHRDVGVNVARDRAHHPDPVARVLEHACLLDVELDPTDELIEEAHRVLPASRLVAGPFRMLPEGPPVIYGEKLLAQLLLGHALGDDAATQEHLPEPRTFLLQKGDELEREVEAHIFVEAADLQRGDDAHRTVVLAAVAVRVAMGADAEHLLPPRTVAGDERAHRVLVVFEA